MAKGRIIHDKSIMKDKSNTKGLKMGYLIRVSDAGMLRKKKEGEELCDSSRLQKAKMKVAAEKKGMIWDERYIVGGKEHQHTTKQFVRNALDREDIQTVSCWIVNKEIEGLMIPYTDRTGRFSPMSRQIFDLLRIHDIRLFELETEYDLDDPEILLILGIKAELAEYKTSLDQNRAYEAKLDNALNHGVYKGGNVLYPYMANPNKEGPYRIPHPEKFKIWNTIRAHYKSNNGKNKYTIEVLSNMFNLNFDTVSNILFRKTFHTGMREVHFYKKRAVGNYKEVDAKVETGGYQPIATEEEYNELIRIRDSRILNKQPGKNRYLLGRRVKCGHSGQWMSGYENHRTGELFYYCYSDNKSGKKKTTMRVKGCGMKVPAKPLERAFLREFEFVCSDPEKLEKALGQHGERFKEIQETRQILKNRILEIDKEDKNLITAIKHADSDEEVIKIVAERKMLLIAKNEKIQEDKELEEEARNLPNADGIKQLMNPRMAAIEKRIKQIDGLSGYTYEEKKQLLDYAFPPSCPRYRRYGITVWKLGENHYEFEAEGIFTHQLLGEFLKTDEGWELDGLNYGKSCYGLT